MVGLSERLEEEEGATAQLDAQRHRLEAECGSLRHDLEELESTLGTVERDKQVRRKGREGRDGGGTLVLARGGSHG